MPNEATPDRHTEAAANRTAEAAERTKQTAVRTTVAAPRTGPAPTAVPSSLPTGRCSPPSDWSLAQHRLSEEDFPGELVAADWARANMIESLPGDKWRATMRAVWYDRQGAAEEVLVCGELPTQINRLGLRPEGETSAPGTNPAAVGLRYRNAASQLPTLEAEIRKLTSLIMASAPKPLQGAHGSGDAATLPPQVAARAEGSLIPRLLGLGKRN